MSDMFAHVVEADGPLHGARRAWHTGRDRRQPVRRASATGLGPDLWEIELHPVRALDALADDIEAVTRAGAEPNIFFTLPLLRAAYPRLARMRSRSLGPVLLLCLYLTRPDESGEERRRLVLFAPLAVPKLGWPGRSAAMVTSTEYTPLGTPLVAADVLDEAVERLLIMLGDPELTLPPVLVLPDSRTDGPVAQAFARALTSLGLPHVDTQTRTRAVHRAGEPLALSRRRQRDHERQLRRLGDGGTITFHAARDEGDVLDAFEAFMVLELASWKGARGSALYNRKHIAAFSRQSVAALARDRACVIHSVRLNGRTIASLIVLGDERTGLYAWKTAFDADHQAASPGVQVLLAATKAVDARLAPGTLVDSLAVEGHPVMDRVWAGRAPMATRLIGLHSRAGAGVDRLARAIRRRDRWRDRAKRLRDTLPF